MGGGFGARGGGMGRKGDGKVSMGGWGAEWRNLHFAETLPDQEYEQGQQCAMLNVFSLLFPQSTLTGKHVSGQCSYIDDQVFLPYP